MAIKELRSFFTNEAQSTDDKETGFAVQHIVDTWKGKRNVFNRLLSKHYASDEVIRKFLASIVFKENNELPIILSKNNRIIVVPKYYDLVLNQYVVTIPTSNNYRVDYELNSVSGVNRIRESWLGTTSLPVDTIIIPTDNYNKHINIEFTIQNVATSATDVSLGIGTVAPFVIHSASAATVYSKIQIKGVFNSTSTKFYYEVYTTNFDNTSAVIGGQKTVHFYTINSFNTAIDIPITLTVSANTINIYNYTRIENYI